MRALMVCKMLGAGGMLASSEWIYWEAVCLIAGHLGVIPLSIHTVPTQVLSVYFIIIFSVGTSLAVRLGASLPVSVDKAQRTVGQAVCFGGLLLTGLVAIMYKARYHIFHLFTSDLDVLRGLDLIWPIVCFYAIQLGVFSLLMGTCTGLGMQWTQGITTAVILWLFGLPTTYYLAVVQDGGILAVWHSLWPPYVLINVVLATAIIRADWNAIADQVRQRHDVPLRRLSLSPRF
jgi:Na+-driven multidrug efflux pump